MLLLILLQDIFTAGSEATTGIVLWAMSEMVKNPKVMEVAQGEERCLIKRGLWMRQSCTN